ncbi:MAG TPA: pyridoxal phosphate-dependent aminotransferase, partial [Bacteroidia bacterium]|nr:pyridoxal phosphate-dependent aminotransferase [Bacteroidia bacterium]
VINLSFGEPDFQTPQHIKDAAKKAIDDGFTFYTPVPGYPELRKAISEKFKNDNHLNYPFDQIVVSTGAKHAIMNTVLALINPGDEVIIPTPYWVSYSEMVKLAEGVPVFVHTTVENDFKPSVEQIKAAITPRTRLFMFSSPCNPTGSVFSKEELKAMADLFAQYPDIYIIADEIYEHITFEGKHESIAEFPEIFERVITVNGVSKGFAMTGWRIGYIGAAKWIAEACEKIQGQFTSGTCSIAQRAALAAITTDLKPTFDMREQFRKRRDLVLELMKEIPGFKLNKPTGAFYVFPDVSYYFGKSFEGKIISDAQELCMFLLNHAHVSLVTGEAFGNGNYIRFSYAASEENLRKALSRIKQALSELK